MAKKPDGKLIRITGRDMNSIIKIQLAMQNAEYKDIKIDRDMSQEAALIKEIKEVNECSISDAVRTFKNMSRMMLAKGVQIIRKEEIINAPIH